MSRPEALAREPSLLDRARRLVALRPLVYAIGVAIGGVALATRRLELVWVMSVVLLSPAAAALLTRVARPRRARLTVEGRVLLIFAVGFLLAALNTGTNLLYYLFGLIASLLLVSLLASSLAFRSLYVRRRAPARVRARETFECEVAIRNEKPFAAYALLVQEARPEGLLDPARLPALFVPRVAGRSTTQGRFEAIFLRRGEHLLEGVAVETRFPFGLIARRIVIAAPQTVLALPVVHPVRNESVGGAASAEAVARRIVRTEERRDVVRSLRDYRPGDHPRAIHWRASARRGALVVKDFERSEPRRALVFLDTYGASDPERVEDAVTLAASLVQELARKGLKVGLAARTPAPAVHAPERGTSPAKLLAVLARLAPPEDGDLGGLVRTARRALERTRVVAVTTRSEAAFREAATGLDDARVLSVAAAQDLARHLKIPAPTGPGSPATAEKALPGALAPALGSDALPGPPAGQEESPA